MAYLDHAATTPMRQCTIDTWARYAGELNPGGQYASGRRANAVLAQAREEIAECVGADPVEVVFTGSGTEANNIAVRGLYRASPLNRVVSSPIEHPAVLETVKSLAADGAQVDYFPVSGQGFVSDLSTLDAPAAVAALMWANNETGAVQPIEEAAARAQAAGTPLHVDAVQVVGKLPVDFRALGVTTLAASAHKFGGPRGIGILLAKRSPAPAPVITGGGQERGLRSGTVDVAAAAATAAALREAVGEMELTTRHVAQLRDELVRAVMATVPETVVTTVKPALPGHAHFRFPGANGDALIMLLDVRGIEASTGSACAAGVNRASHVLQAMAVPEREAAGALRLTLGRTSTRDDVALVVREIADVVERARVAGSL